MTQSRKYAGSGRASFAEIAIPPEPCVPLSQCVSGSCQLRFRCACGGVAGLGGALAEWWRLPPPSHPLWKWVTSFFVLLCLSSLKETPVTTVPDPWPLTIGHFGSFRQHLDSSPKAALHPHWNKQTKPNKTLAVCLKMSSEKSPWPFLLFWLQRWIEFLYLTFRHLLSE